MKHVTIKRAWCNEKVTLGMLKIEGVDHHPICTLENPERDTTVDSRIPAGTYICAPYSSAKFPDVYEVLKVPGRTHILIHVGNTEKDTTGCILLGTNLGRIKGEPAISGSIAAMTDFKELIGKERFSLRIE